MPPRLGYKCPSRSGCSTPASHRCPHRTDPGESRPSRSFALQLRFTPLGLQLPLYSIMG